MQGRLPKLKKCVSDAALRFNLVPGHKKYTRFIILGMGRSGSNFLATSLRSHKNIVSFGEIFNNARHDRLFWEYPGYRSTAKQLELRRNHPCRFLEELVFKKMSTDVLAVGFKLFYYHANEPEWAPVWEYLRKSNIFAIHLKRKNLLRLHLSMKLALDSRKWSARTEKETRKQKTVALDHQECVETFTKVTQQHRDFDSFFDKQMDIYYEDLISDYQSNMAGIEDFLGVPAQATTATTKRQSRLPLSAAITNYNELKHQFCGTEWADFFDD